MQGQARTMGMPPSRNKPGANMQAMPQDRNKQATGERMDINDTLGRPYTYADSWPRHATHATWNDAMRAALAEIEAHQPELGLVPPEVTMNNIEWAVNGGRTKQGSYLGTFKDAAKYSLAELSPTVAALIPDLLLQRQMKYGKKNVSTFMYVGIGIRMHDKLSRLTHAKKDQDFADETVQDTRMDIVGYTAIAIMLTHGQWELPVQTSMF